MFRLPGVSNPLGSSDNRGTIWFSFLNILAGRGGQSFHTAILLIYEPLAWANVETSSAPIIEGNIRDGARTRVMVFSGTLKAL